MSPLVGGFLIGVTSCVVVPALGLALVVGVARWGIARDKKRGARKEAGW